MIESKIGFGGNILGKVVVVWAKESRESAISTCFLTLLL